jgi:chemotaxis protein MotA
MGVEGVVLLDAEAGVLVLVGTLLASVLSQGTGNLRMALQQTVALARAPVDEVTNRAALARVLHAIKRDGWHRTEVGLPPDPRLAEMVGAYLRLGDLAHMQAALAAQRNAAKAQRRRAVAMWRTAGELAPVAGLAGTLYAITGLVPDVDAGLAQTTAEAMATAAVSTLYGLALAHLVCLPLAGALARRSRAEEAVRERLATWFEAELAKAGGLGSAPSATPALVEAA